MGELHRFVPANDAVHRNHVIGLTVSDDNQVEFRLELRRPESNFDLLTGKLTGSGLFDNGMNLAVNVHVFSKLGDLVSH